MEKIVINISINFEAFIGSKVRSLIRKQTLNFLFPYGWRNYFDVIVNIFWVGKKVLKSNLTSFVNILSIKW